MADAYNEKYPEEKAIEYATSMIGKTYETEGTFINDFLLGIGFKTPNYLPDHPAPTYPHNSDPYVLDAEKDNETIALLKELGYKLSIAGNPPMGQLGIIAKKQNTWRGWDTCEKGLAIRIGASTTYDVVGIKYPCYDLVYYDYSAKTAKRCKGFDITVGSGGYYPDPSWIEENADVFYCYGFYWVEEIPTYETTKVTADYYYGDPVYGGKLTVISSKTISDTEVEIALPDKVPNGYKGAGQPFDYCTVNLSVYTTTTFRHIHPAEQTEIKVTAYYNDYKGHKSQWIYYM